MHKEIEKAVLKITQAMKVGENYMRSEKEEYDLYQKKLLRMVKTKGVLVKKMNKSDNFLVDASTQYTLYKKSLGAVEKYDIFHKKIKHIYVVYEDFDNIIKYYDYPK